MSSFPPPPPNPGGWGARPAWGTPAGPYGYQAGTPAQAMQSLQGLAVALTVLLPLAGLVAIFNAFAFYNRASINERFEGFGGTPADLVDQQEASDVVSVGLGFFALAVLASGIVFVIWQFRHAKNAEARGGSLGLGPGWAIGGWFIPCANYVLPPIQLHQSAKSSDPETPRTAARASGRTAPMIWLWAVAWGIGQTLITSGNLTYDAGLDEDRLITNPSDLVFGDRMAGIGYAVVVLASILAVGMVRELTARQSRAFERDLMEGAVGSPLPPPPVSPWGPRPPAWDQPAPAPWGQQPTYQPPPSRLAPPPPRPSAGHPPPPPPPPPRREPPGPEEPGWGAPT